MPRKKQPPEATITALRKELADYKTMYESASKSANEGARKLHEAVSARSDAEAQLERGRHENKALRREIASLQRDLERAYGFIEGQMNAKWPGAMRGTLHGATEDFSATVERMKQDRGSSAAAPVTQTAGEKQHWLERMEKRRNGDYV
jgi:chromosome segregation ATPase